MLYDSRRPDALALVDNGDAVLLAGLAVRDAESRYLGGVTNEVPGVNGEVVDGRRPRSERCVGVRGMSEKLSLGRNRGYNARRMFTAKISCKISSEKSG